MPAEPRNSRPGGGVHLAETRPVVLPAGALVIVPTNRGTRFETLDKWRVDLAIERGHVAVNVDHALIATVAGNVTLQQQDRRLGVIPFLAEFAAKRYCKRAATNAIRSRLPLALMLCRLDLLT